MRATIAGAGTVDGTGTLYNAGAIRDTVAIDMSGGLAVTGHHYAVTFNANGGTGAPAREIICAASLSAAGLSAADRSDPSVRRRGGGWHRNSRGGSVDGRSREPPLRRGCITWTIPPPTAGGAANAPSALAQTGISSWMLPTSEVALLLIAMGAVQLVADRRQQTRPQSR
ncbi:MAG: hypothetical protein L0H26_06425 [Microlunatus sp.]|nr:hypothetical protein [Microlunatus sp.]